MKQHQSLKQTCVITYHTMKLKEKNPEYSKWTKSRNFQMQFLDISL